MQPGRQPERSDVPAAVLIWHIGAIYRSHTLFGVHLLCQLLYESVYFIVGTKNSLLLKDLFDAAARVLAFSGARSRAVAAPTMAPPINE